MKRKPIINSQGYVLIYSPNHPFKDHDGYVCRSRIIMEKHLGRYLKFKEVVHHINKIKNDDREKNLKLYTNNGKHLSETLQGTKQKRNRNYLVLNKIPKWKKENAEFVIPSQGSKRYICKGCDICNKLFWTKKRMERPLAKTCSDICLSNLMKGVYNARTI